MATPACDMACQRQKELDGLLKAMNAAENTNPEAYEQARVKYYTLKDGQTWLHAEKESIARQKVQPILNSYTKKYEALQQQLEKSNQDAELTQLLQSREVGDEEETRYLHKKLMQESDKVGVAKRLSMFGSSINYGYSWIPILLDVIFAISVIAILYYGFVVGKITRYFTSFMAPTPNTL